ncbi:31387_t:CDS:1, partial [Racocetra persica]
NNSKYNSDIEYIFDNNIQEEVESSTSIPRQKAVEEPAEEPDTKNIHINFFNPNKSRKKSYV